MTVRRFQDVKRRFGELVRAAKRHGPQEIVVRVRTAVVVIAGDEYDRLRRPRPPFWEFMRGSPLVGAELDLERDRSPTRAVSL